jgi:hypothetical protein
MPIGFVVILSRLSIEDLELTRGDDALEEEPHNGNEDEEEKGGEDGGHRFDKRHCEEDGQTNDLDERVPVQLIQLDPSKFNAGYLLVSQGSLSDMRSKRGFTAIDEAKEDTIEYRLRHQFEGRRQRRQDGDQHVEGELRHALLCYGVRHLD